MIELKIKSAASNPRLLLVNCNDVAIFLASFKKKTNKLPRAEIDRADDRYQTMKDDCQ